MTIRRKETCAANIIKPTQICINHEKHTFCVIKLLEHLKNVKTGRGLYLGVGLTMHVFKSQIHLGRQYL